MIFRISPNVSLEAGNPYLRLFSGALEPFGIHHTETMRFDVQWLREKRDAIDALHFHWPERYWERIPVRLRPTIERVGRFNSFVVGFFERRIHRWKLNRFIRYLRIARALGYRILWTHHNAAPHTSITKVDQVGYEYLANCSDLVICHSESDNVAFCSAYPNAEEPVLMRHGNFRPIFPQPAGISQIRRQLGLPLDRPVAGCVGSMRGNKGLDVALEAACLEDEVRFLFAGEPVRFDASALIQAGEQRNNVVTISRRLSEQEFVDFVAACDLILLPYAEVTTSGALLAAFSCDRPVVTSPQPYFVEMLRDHPSAGKIASRNDAGAIVTAIHELIAIPASERNTAARKIADDFDWSNVIKPVVDQIHYMADRELENA